MISDVASVFGAGEGIREAGSKIKVPFGGPAAITELSEERMDMNEALVD